MWDDDVDMFGAVRPEKKSGKFFTYEELGWSMMMAMNSQFRDYLYEHKMSASAIRTYPAEVSLFYGWIQDESHHEPPRHLYRDHVIKYRDHLVSGRVKPQTINHKLSALRKYNEYLIAHKHQRNEVFRRGDFLKIRPKTPKAFGLPDSRISTFVKRVSQDGNLRDIALVTLLAKTGMKLQEALDLRLFDVDWDHGQVSVNAGDKKKARAVALDEQTVEILQAYRQIRLDRYPKAMSYFFAAQGSDQLTYSTVNRLFQKHSKTITPKILRQWYQIGLLRQGATVAEVVYLTGADAQTVSGLVKRQVEAIEIQV